VGVLQRGDIPYLGTRVIVLEFVSMPHRQHATRINACVVLAAFASGFQPFQVQQLVGHVLSEADTVSTARFDHLQSPFPRSLADLVPYMHWSTFSPVQQ